MLKRISLVLGVLLSIGVACFITYNVATVAGEWAGYRKGYTAGEVVGYSAGKKDGYGEGNAAGEVVGYSAGKKDGYGEGNAAGEVVGYSAGKKDGYGEGNTAGEVVGYSAGKKDGYGEGLNTGKKDGYQGGYDEGYKSGAQASLGHGYTLRDSTYAEALAFLAQDKTSENKYDDPIYVCSHFARDVGNNAESKGLRCAFVEIRYPDTGHTIIAFNTIGKGLAFFEPQHDEGVKPVIGKRFYQCVEPREGYYYDPPSYDDTINDVLVIW